VGLTTVADIQNNSTNTTNQATGAHKLGEVPDGLWVKCERCGGSLYRKELDKDLRVCKHCGHHFRLGAHERIAITADAGTFVERDRDMRHSDPLHFPDYRELTLSDEQRTGLRDAVVWGECTIGGFPVALAVADFSFRGGSMGSVVGEKVTRAIDHAVEARQPVVIFCASGGARMQEGILSLMQMAKTAAAAGRLHRAGLPYITALTDPTTAGTLASYASLSDIIIAEPGARLYFAGPRVIEQNLKIKVPPDLLSSEFHLQHGMVDMVVHRRDLSATLSRLLRLLS